MIRILNVMPYIAALYTMDVELYMLRVYICNITANENSTLMLLDNEVWLCHVVWSL